MAPGSYHIRESATNLPLSAKSGLQHEHGGPNGVLRCRHDAHRIDLHRGHLNDVTPTTRAFMIQTIRTRFYRMYF